MKNILKAEFYKLKKDISNLLILIISIIVSSVLLLDSNIHNGSEALYQTFYNMSLVLMIANIFVSLYIGRNFSDRQINRYIESGHKRKDLFLAQSLISIIYTNLILILQPFIVIIIFSVTKGWGEIFTISQGIKIILITILLNSALVSVLIFLAFLLKKPGSTLVACTALYFLTIFLLNSQKALLIARLLPLGQERLLIENGTSNIESIIVALAYILIFNIFSIKYFEKCDLK